MAGAPADAEKIRLLRHIVPRLRQRGLGEADVRMLIVDDPAAAPRA